MLSNSSRWLTYLTGMLYAILGFLLFFLPECSAPGLALIFTFRRLGTGIAS